MYPNKVTDLRQTMLNNIVKIKFPSKYAQKNIEKRTQRNVQSQLSSYKVKQSQLMQSIERRRDLSNCEQDMRTPN